MNNYNNYNYNNNNSVENDKNATTTSNNTHSLHHAVNQLSSNNPYNNTPFDNSFVPTDNNIFILPQIGDNGNNGHVSNEHKLLNNGSDPEGPVADMHHLALQQASQNVAVEVSNGSQQPHSTQPLSSSHVVQNLNSPRRSGAMASIYASQEQQAIGTLNRLLGMLMDGSANMNNATTLETMEMHRKNMDAIQVQIKKNKATYHQIYPNNPAFFLAQANSGESSVGSASSQNTAKAKRTERLPKDIPYLNTPFARNPDPAAKKVEFNTAEAWADKVERVMNYNGLDTKEHMNNFWRRIVKFALATQHAKRLTNELKENVDQLAGHDDYTWQQVRETIIMLFDTTAEHRLHIKVINCCQQSNESLNSFVQRFSDLTYKAKLPQRDALIRELMFENMMPSTKQLAIDHANVTYGADWPVDIEHFRRLFANFTTLPNTNTIGSKRSYSEQPSRCHQHERKFKQPKRNLQVPEGACIPCFRHEKGKFVPFNNGRHNCPHDPRKPITANNCFLRKANKNKAQSKQQQRPKRNDTKAAHLLQNNNTSNI